MLSCFSCVQLFVTLWTIARQAPLSMGFSRQEYWSRSPFPSPGNLPNPWIKPVSPGSPTWAGEIFITDSTVQPLKSLYSFADFWKIVRIIHMGPFDCVDQNKLWEILKGMEISDHLTCLLRNLHEGWETTVRTGHGTIDTFQIRKGVHQGFILSPCLFRLYAEYIMQNAGLFEAQESRLESRLLGEISITLDMQMAPPLWQRAKKN